MGMNLQLSQELELHESLTCPDLTDFARFSPGNLEDVVARGILSHQEKMSVTEYVLFDLWNFSHSWRACLDAPLISHADSALKLNDEFDAVLSIENAGKFYADIFKLMGAPVFTIDYSHHKRNMQKPELANDSLEELRQKDNILLMDVDFITGKTLTTVYNFLHANKVKVGGAYLGLSSWSGGSSNKKKEKNVICNKTVKFKTFWKNKTTGLMQLRSKKPYELELIPPELKLFAPNPTLADNLTNGSAAARRIANYLIQKQNESYTTSLK